LWLAKCLSNGASKIANKLLKKLRDASMNERHLGSVGGWYISTIGEEGAG